MVRMMSEVGCPVSQSPPTFLFFQILTEEVFTTALSSYLATFAYSTATEDDLFFHLEVFQFLFFSLTILRRRP